MIDSLGEIDALLKGTELEGSVKIKLDIPESSNCAFAIKVNAENSLCAWSILRALVDETGRYPVLAGEGSFASHDWAVALNERELFSCQEFRNETSHSVDKNCSPEVVIERSRGINLIQALEHQQQRETWLPLDKLINHEIDYTSTRFGVAPLKEAVLTAFQPQPDRVSESVAVGVEKWLFNWELEHFAPDTALIPPDLQYLYLDWYYPGDSLDYALILLPTVHSWETLAYIHWLGAGRSEVMVALLKSWQERFKAELVAHDSLNLLFNVYQKPLTPEDAFLLAVEHETFAGDTLNLHGISIRDHARALLILDRWCLLSKP